MYTLQILDAGQTFLHTLGERPVSLGASEQVDVSLRESDVESEHARLIPHAKGVRLEAAGEVLVNGSSVREAELQLGDRIELGRAVLIVGRTVSRAAKPEDVLAGSVSRSPRRPKKKSASRFLPAIAGAAVLGLVVTMALQGDDSVEIRGLVGGVEQLRAAGKLDEARAEASRLRRQWAGAEDDRLERLAKVEAAIDEVDATHASLVAMVTDPDGTQTYAELSTEMQRLEAEGSRAEKVAARKVRSRLAQHLRQRTAAVRKRAIANRGAGPAAGSAGSTAPANEAAGAADAAGASDVAGPGQHSSTAAVAVDEIERYCRDGLYAQALSLVQAGFEQAGDAQTVAELRTLEATVRERAKLAMGSLLTEARASEQQGRLQHAVTLLQMGRHRFPSSAAFRPLGDELQRLQEESAAVASGAAASTDGSTTPSSDGQMQPAASKPSVAAAGSKQSGQVDEATRLQTLASLRAHMDHVRTAEEDGDYAKAADLLRTAAQGVRSRDPEFADRLVVRASDAALLASWHQAVVAALTAAGGKPLVATDSQGQSLELLRLEGHQILARSPDGEGPLNWLEVDPAAMQSLAQKLKVGGEAALGLASLLYQSGSRQTAEAVLVDLARADGGLQPRIDRVLARGRGEAIGGGDFGYVLRRGEFVSVRKLELEKLSKKLIGKLDRALRAKDKAARTKFLTATVAEGALQAEALAYAMKSQFDKVLGHVDASSLRRQVDKMTGERDRLDQARKHAKDLIYDEQRYFYPYRPPAVSGEKHAEYNRVQAEVNERVAAVRAIWKQSKLKLRVPTKLGQELEQLDWMAVQISRLGGMPDGESVASLLAPVEWARALEPGEEITVRNFSLTAAERAQRQKWRKIEAYNEAVADDFSVSVMSLLRITNEYRAMFQHRPLAVVLSACAGSQGHADEMSRLGYFAHMSPTPGRRTPHDRMRLAGYMFGVSENIAKVGGAQGAHNAWCRSSGHHRNLLSPSHREIGIGANGRYWVQNFGSGEVHKTHKVWPTLHVK